MPTVLYLLQNGNGLSDIGVGLLGISFLLVDVAQEGQPFNLPGGLVYFRTQVHGLPDVACRCVQVRLQLLGFFQVVLPEQQQQGYFKLTRLAFLH